MASATLRSVLVVGALVLLGAQPAGAAGRFDGTYTGTATLQPGNNVGNCRTFTTSITVTNDRLTYVHGANVAVVNADVAADGSFNGSGQYMVGRTPAAQTLTGKITGGKLEGDTSSPYCKYHLFLNKAG